MTLHALTLPKWGLAMEDGTLTAWLAPAGSTVRQGQEVAEIETSKIANVIEAPASGVLRRVVVHPGEVVPVGALLGVLADGGEPEAAVEAFVGGYETPPLRPAQNEAAAPVCETRVVDGQRVRFMRVAAADGPRAGAPAVLLHGFGGDHLNWMYNQAAMAVDRDVYAIDLPGHGGSSKSVGDGTLDYLATHVGEWLNALGLDRVHLVGHSMGAAVAATLALAQPERVLSLACVCGAGLGGRINRAYLDGFVAATRRKDLQPVVGLLFSDPALATRDMVDALAAYKRIDGVAEALRQLGDNALADAALEQLHDRLAAIPVPMLAIWGGADRIVSPCPGVRLPGDCVTIEAAGHMPHMEAASAVNGHLVAHLRAHDPLPGFIS